MGFSRALRLVFPVLATVTVGLLAGLMVGTGMDQFTHRALPEASWTLEHQVMDALFRRVMPIWFNLAALFMILATIVSRGTRRWYFGVSALLIIFCIVVTVSIEVPINRSIDPWIPGSAPANWAAIRDRWLWFHLVRTSLGVVAFLCATIGLARSQAQN